VKTVSCVVVVTGFGGVVGGDGFAVVGGDGFAVTGV